MIGNVMLIILIFINHYNKMMKYLLEVGVMMETLMERLM